MEYDKINNLLGSPRDNLSKFVTKKFLKVNDLSGNRANRYNDKKQIRFKTPMLRSDLCSYSDAYISVKGTIIVTAPEGVNNNRDEKNRPSILKNNVPFISCFSKINGELIENAEDLDVVMPMYNLIEYSKNYGKTTGSLYNFDRDELSNDDDNANFPNIQVINSKTFQYKTNIIGNTYSVDPADGNYDANKEGTQKVEIAVPLKYLGNFWRSLNMPLISCEVLLELKWDKNCEITSLECRADGDNLDNSPTGATFSITDCNLYVPVVTLSKNDKNELLMNLKSRFKRIVKWNKYMSQSSNYIANDNLNVLIDPTFTNVNRLFVLSFENDNDNQDNRISFSTFYLPKFQIKDFNVIIDKMQFFDLPIKNEEEAYEQIIEIGRNSEYNTGNLLDYEKYYRIIVLDLSKQQVLQENKDLIQQINFIGRLEVEATIFFIIEKKEDHQFIINLLNKNDTKLKRFATKRWYIINDLNGAGNYGNADVQNNIKYETKMLKANLCDYADAYILVTGRIEIVGGNANSRASFRNCAPFIKCILRINYEHIEASNFLDIVMPTYNLIEYSDNYQDASATLYQYKRHDPPGNINNNFTADNSESFKHKASALGAPVAVGANAKISNAKIAVPLKYLSNFFRCLEMPLINCKIHLELEWTSHCVLCTQDARFIIEEQNYMSQCSLCQKKITMILLSSKIKDFSDQFIGMNTK